MRAFKPPGATGHLRRVGVAALIALSFGLVAIVVGQGFSTIGAVKVIEDLALGAVVIALFVGAVALVAVRMADWREPESEIEFERLIRHSEALARSGSLATTEPGFSELDPLVDEDFEELVRDALDELPDLLVNALRHVAVVISNGGRRVGAYGLYQGGGRGRGDDSHDRIIIFRDTLRRDFGHDPELLREQVVRTVRHELAHHVGFDELGVSTLDL
ncbi:MAG TPA: metallopeptidase family protein [Solirubrobacteraceae bacterium]|jgi:predicted Zn-dependent protease with MMP-like domain